MSKKDKLDNGYRLDDFGLLFSDEKSKTREKSILLRKKNAESSADSANSQNLDKNNPRAESSENNPRAESSENNSSLRDSAKQNRGNPKDLRAKRSNHPPIEKIQDLQSGLPREQNLLARNDENVADSAKSAESNALSSKPQSKEIKEQDFIYAPQFQGFDEILEESKDFSVQDFKVQDFGAQKQGAESSAKTQLTPQNEKDLLLRHPHTQNDTNALFIAYSILFLMLLAFMPQIYLANNIYTSSKNINLLKAQKDALRDENSDLQKQLESVKFNFLTLEIEEIK